jgi:hypothetical protein
MVAKCREEIRLDEKLLNLESLFRELLEMSFCVNDLGSLLENYWSCSKGYMFPLFSRCPYWDVHQLEGYCRVQRCNPLKNLCNPFFRRSAKLKGFR